MIAPCGYCCRSVYASLDAVFAHAKKYTETHGLRCIVNTLRKICTFKQILKDTSIPSWAHVPFGVFKEIIKPSTMSLHRSAHSQPETLP